MTDREREAEDVAKMICQYFGFDFSDLAERQDIRWLDGGENYVEAWRLTILAEMQRKNTLSKGMLQMISARSWVLRFYGWIDAHNRPNLAQESTRIDSF
jgi:hypothetical protein